MNSQPTADLASSRPLRGIVFSKYGSRAASTRQRFIQIMPYLSECGISLDILPLFDNTYLETLFTHNRRHPWRILCSYFRRFYDLARIRDYDFIMVQYELFPYMPGILEALLHFTRKPVIYDIDDAIFHQYDTHRNPVIRCVLRNKLKALLQRTDLAFCGNSYLASYVSRYAKQTEIVPTTVNTEQYHPATAPRTESRTVLGWIGSPSTWAYCQPLLDDIKSLISTRPLSFLVIGAEHHASSAYPFEFRTWDETREVADICDMDIGIMPIPDEPWARGKCGYKLIQYMACGLPVIASPVGVNREIVTHGVNGFLASTPQEWLSAIVTLSQDAALRERMGAAGSKRAIEHYSIQQHGPRLAHQVRMLCSQL